MKFSKQTKRIRRILNNLKSGNKLNLIGTLLFSLIQGKNEFKRAEKLTKTGFVLTGFWIFVISITSIFRKEPIWALSLNNLGDFFAGTFAPLALLWFIIGYFQHSKELRLQRLELALQREEFNFHGQQAKRQADAIEKQVEIDEIALKEGKAGIRPKLVYENTTKTSSKEGISLNIYFRNIGGPAIKAKLFSSVADITKPVLKPNNNIYPEKDIKYAIQFRTTTQAQLPIPLVLEYEDSEGNLYKHDNPLSDKFDINSEFFTQQKKIK